MYFQEHSAQELQVIFTGVINIPYTLIFVRWLYSLATQQWDGAVFLPTYWACQTCDCGKHIYAASPVVCDFALFVYRTVKPQLFLQSLGIFRIRNYIFPYGIISVLLVCICSIFILAVIQIHCPILLLSCTLCMATFTVKHHRHILYCSLKGLLFLFVAYTAFLDELMCI